MPAFDLTGEISFRAVNLGSIAKQVKDGLKVDAPVNLKFDRTSRENVRAIEVQLRGLNKELASVTRNAKSAKDALNQLGAAFNKLGSGATSAAKTEREMTKIKKSTQEATSQIEEFGRVSGLALRRNAGFLLATGVVFGFVNAVKDAFSESIKFERQLVKVAQVTGRSVKSLGSLTKEVSRLATSLGVSSESLIEVAQTLAQAGLSANQTEKALGALAKTTLAATFGDIQQTTEGAIALMAQFGIQAKDLEKALSSVNSVAGAFAVESDDIIAAIKRAGGVFAATSKGVSQGADALNEFIAVFTSVRATTRESAETIATGLRTIFTRIQRPQTIQFLRELGISLTDVEGKFVGPFEAVNRLSRGLAGLDTRNPLFARVIEELGGFRQVGKVIPLLAQTEVRMKALTVAQQGLNSLNEDSAQAQQALSVQIARTGENFLKLIRDIGQTSTFRELANSILEITNRLIELASAIKPVLPLIAAFGIAKGVSAGVQFASGFLGKGIRGKFHSGGLVPGGKGVKDDFPATLQTGEFVIRRSSVDKIGVDTLNALNQGRMKFAAGGKVPQRDLSIGTPEAPLISGLFLQPTAGRGDSVANKALTSGSLKASLVKAGIVDANFAGKINIPVGKNFVDPGSAKKIKNLTANSLSELIGRTSRIFGPEPIDDIDKYLQDIGINDITGKVYEASLAAGLGIKRTGDSARGIDFEGGDITKLGKVFGPINSPFADAKLTDTIDSVRSIRDKIITRIGSDPSFFANYGSRIRRNRGGGVPALLTRGEFVLNKNAASRIGPAGLNALNNADIQGFATGGGPGFKTSRRKLKPSEIAALLGDDPRDRPLTQAQKDFVARFQGQSVISNRTDAAGLFDPFSQPRLITNDPIDFQEENLGGILNSSTANPRSARLRRLQRIGLAGRRRGNLTGGLGRLSGSGSLLNTAKNKLGRFGGVAATAGVIGGQFIGDQIGGATGSAISGAIGGASTGAFIGGSVGGPVGAAVGAVLGGVASAIQSFQSAKLAEQIEKAAKRMNKSIESVEDAIANFADDKNLAKLQASFQGLTDSAVESAQADVANSDFTNFIGLRNDRFQAAEEITGIQLKEEKALNLEVGKNLASNLGSAGAGVQSALEEIFTKTNVFEDAVKQLSDDQLVALAASRADKTEKEALGSVATDRAQLISVSRAQVLGDAELRAQQDTSNLAKQFKELEAAMKGADKGTDLLVERLGNFSAVLDRAAEAGLAAQQANESLVSRRSGGAGIRSSVRQNVFNNLRGFTTDEVASEVGVIRQSLGNSRNAREFTGSLLGAKQIQTNLPRVLNELSVSLKDFDVAQLGETRLVQDTVSQNFGNLPKVLQDKLGNDIRAQFLNRLSSPDQLGNEGAGGGFSDFANNFTKDIVAMGKKFVDVFNKNIAEFETVLNQWVSLNAEANASMDKFAQIQAENALSLSEIRGEFIGSGRVGRVGSIQTAQFAARAGSASLNADALIAREQFLVNQSNSLANSGGAGGEFAQAMTNLSVQQQNAVSALRSIVENTAESAALQSELNGIIDARGQARGILEDFQFGSPETRQQIERQVGLATQLRNGGSVLSSQLEDARAGQRILDTFARAQGPEAAFNLDQQFLRQTANNVNAQRLFQLTQGAGFNQNQDLTQFLFRRDANFQSRAGRLEDIGREKARAQQGLANIDRRDASTFLANGQQAFNEQQNALFNADGLLNRLNDNLANLDIPRSIEIGGNIQHTIVVNGTVQGQFGEEIEKKVKQMIADAFRKTQPLDGPSARRN